MCTGKATNEVIVDVTNANVYHICGECSLQRTVTCEAGKKYDAQCNKCVTGQFPNCDDAGIYHIF